ncbi:MAG: 30S ribosomal protein S17 [Bacillales bacterium]|nr:30S ribosomal protein S17 [Bacillales bacterium]
MEDRKTRKVFTGIVVSALNDKTITVKVDTYKKHPLYSKRVMSSKKFRAHDENNEAKAGDKVKIMETRPLSATKRFRLLEIVEKKIEV